MKLTNLVVPSEGYMSVDSWYTIETNETGNYIQHKEEDGSTQWLVPVKSMDKWFVQMANAIMWHTVTFDNCPHRKKFIEGCVGVLLKSNLSEEGILNMTKLIEKETGLNTVLLPAKMVAGGRTFTKLMFSKGDPFELIAKSISDKYCEALYALPHRKRFEYNKMIIGELVKFKTPDGRKVRVEIRKGDSLGELLLRKSVAEASEMDGLFGKAGGCSKATIVVKEDKEMPRDIDIVIWESEDKLKLNDAEEIANAIGFRPSCSPKVRCGKGLPTTRFDGMIIEGHKIDGDLSRIKAIIHSGEMEPKDVYDLLSYEQDGIKKITRFLRPLVLGAKITTPIFYTHVMQALTTATQKEIFVKVYGKTMTIVNIKHIPNEVPMEELAFKRYPNPIALGIKGKIWWDEGVVGATPEDIKKLGGDFDGDQAEVRYLCNGILVVPTEEYEGVLPTKGDAVDDIATPKEIWASIIASLSKVGSIHNESAVLISLFRHLGITDEQVIKLAYELIWYDEKVIQTFKHDNKADNDDEKILKIEDRAKKWRDEFELEIKDKELQDMLIREMECSGIVRGDMLHNWIKAANGSICPNPDGPFFERWLSHFKWQIDRTPIDAKDMVKVDKIRRDSFKVLKKTTNQLGSKSPSFNSDNMDTRWEWVKKKLDGIDEARKYTLNAFIKRDYDHANNVYDRYIKHMRDVWGLENVE